MTPALHAAAALYADAALHEDIAEQFSGTGEEFFEGLVKGHRESARLAYRQADAIIRATLKDRHASES